MFKLFTLKKLIVFSLMTPSAVYGESCFTSDYNTDPYTSAGNRLAHWDASVSESFCNGKWSSLVTADEVSLRYNGGSNVQSDGTSVYVPGNDKLILDKIDNSGPQSEFTVFMVAALDTCLVPLTVGHVHWEGHGIMSLNFQIGKLRWSTIYGNDALYENVRETNCGDGIRRVYAVQYNNAGQHYGTMWSSEAAIVGSNTLSTSGSNRDLDINVLSSGFVVGIDYYSYGGSNSVDLSELIVYDSALSLDEMKSIVDKLMKKWLINDPYYDDYFPPSGCPWFTQEGAWNGEPEN
jgi:hypothetical protein